MAGQAEPGRLVGGRYRLLARLGSGGMGRVWRAGDEALRIEVAIKEVWLPATPGPDADERLRRAEREARNAARLRDHPNVVAVHDVVVEDGVPWTVMQLVAGHTLEEHVEEFGPLSVAHVALIAGALLDALEAAHAAGIVHRDVKPANVMLADDGQVLLTDFGIALANADTALTAAGSFLGSVEYIAPERARGTEGLPASDLFSLGVTLFQAVEGFSPFHRETATGTLTAVILDEAPAPVRAGRLAPLLTRLLEKDPGARVGIAEARRLLAVPEAAGVPAQEAAAVPTRNEVAAREAGAISAPSAPRRPGTAPGTTVPRGSAQRGSGAVPLPRQTGSGRRPPQGTDQRPTGPSPRPIRPGPRPPQGPDQRRRPPIAPSPPRAGRRSRGVVLLLLIVATVGGVLFAVIRRETFDVTTVKTGDFVRVDSSGHIVGKFTESRARSSVEGRRVTARADSADPDVCKKFHALGRPDVEDSVSFCLVRPAEEAAPPPAQ